MTLYIAQSVYMTCMFHDQHLIIQNTGSFIFKINQQMMMNYLLDTDLPTCIIHEIMMDTVLQYVIP